MLANVFVVVAVALVRQLVSRLSLLGFVAHVLLIDAKPAHTGPTVPLAYCICCLTLRTNVLRAINQCRMFAESMSFPRQWMTAAIS